MYSFFLLFFRWLQNSIYTQCAYSFKPTIQYVYDQEREGNKTPETVPKKSLPRKQKTILRESRNKYKAPHNREQRPKPWPNIGLLGNKLCFAYCVLMVQVGPYKFHITCIKIIKKNFFSNNYYPLICIILWQSQINISNTRSFTGKITPKLGQQIALLAAKVDNHALLTPN